MYLMSRALRLAAPALLVAALAACGGGGEDGDDGNSTPGNAVAGATVDPSTVSGDVVVDGSSTVGPVTEAIAEEFGKVSEVRVSVGISGTSGGFEKFCRGETDINDASRRIRSTEEIECANRQINFLELKIGVDGLTLAVNAENDWATCLTYSQLKQIWNTGSTISKWSDIDPSFPDEELLLFSPGADSGTFDYFTEEVNGALDAMRNDAAVSFSEDDHVLVAGVQANKGALAFFGYAYYLESQDTLKALQVDKDQDGAGNPVAQRRGCLAPEKQAINDGFYPLSRPLYIYVSMDALERPEVAAFINYYLDNAKALVGDVGYVPLADAEYAQQKNKLAATLGQ